MKNGGHCYFADNNFACNLGETFCGNDFVITREEQHETTFAFLNLWLDYTLNDNEHALVEFNDAIQSSNLVNYEQTCTSLNTNENINNDTFAIYPNPVKNKFTINTPGEACNGKYTISNLYGQIVQQNKTTNCTLFNLYFICNLIANWFFLQRSNIRSWCKNRFLFHMELCSSFREEYFC